MYRFANNCVGLGFRRGAIAGLLLPVGVSLFSALVGVFDPNSLVIHPASFVWENLIIMVYTVLFSLPLGALIGSLIGFVFGLISYAFFTLLSRPQSKLVINSFGFAMAAIVALTVGWLINLILGLWAIASPNLANQFSVPGAILAFIFAYTSRFQIENWYFGNS